MKFGFTWALCAGLVWTSCLAAPAPGHPIRNGADFLLSPFKRQQDKELDELVGQAADAVSSIIAEGVEKAMTRFNRRAPGLNTEEA